MQQQSEQNQQTRAPPENSKLGIVAVLTATSTTTATDILMNLLPYNSETLKDSNQICNQTPLKYRNLAKIYNELVKKVKNYSFSDRTQGCQI